MSVGGGEPKDVPVISTDKLTRSEKGAGWGIKCFISKYGLLLSQAKSTGKSQCQTDKCSIIDR